MTPLELQPVPHPSPRPSLAVKVALILVSMMAGGVLTWSLLGRLPGFAQAAPLYDEQKVVSIYQQAGPAVVKVQVVQDRQTILGSGEAVGQGSGFLIDGQGNILTNYHVAQGATQIRVTLSSGKELDAEVLGTDPAEDLALLRVDPAQVQDISPLPLGDSAVVRPGQMAIALGSPFGLQGSVTVGVISGVGRSLPSVVNRPITEVLQTDAAIYPGNSGGPLLDSNGSVVGINTAIESGTGSGRSIGFAVPINTAKRALPALMAKSQVRKPWMGISGMPMTRALAGELGVEYQKGVYVTSVFSGSPAEQAGLQGAQVDRLGESASGGDLITSADEQPVASVEDLVAYLNGKQPGDQVTLTVVREGEQLSLTVTLAPWPDEPLRTTPRLPRRQR
ncbi:MAG: trypsin-like peptidase domain-containing protein [Chloroflexi bacterium]|nr:trypsin-like peptidase domain-containing protein [Chloroflexota bacterium]